MKDIFQTLDGIATVLTQDRLAGDPAREKVTVTLTFDRKEFGEAINQIRQSWSPNERDIQPIPDGYRVKYKGVEFRIEKIRPKITFKDYNSFY